MDFAALPPEINSGLMYTGPGAAPMLAAAVAWDVLAGELYSTALSSGTVISDLTSGWLGPSSQAMAAAAAPYVSWISATAGQAEQAGAQAKAAVAAFEAAFAMTVPPPVIAANRALLMALIATNFFGQNTPAIMATEAHYMEMWAQDAAAMYGYAAAAQAASTLTPFTSPLPTTNPAALGGLAAAVAQATGTSAGTSAQVAPTLTAAVAAPNAMSWAAATTSSALSPSPSSPLLSLSNLTSSSLALTSAAGPGSSAAMPTTVLPVLVANGLTSSMGAVAGALSNQLPGLGGGFGAGVLGSTGMVNAAVTAGAGQASSLGLLSVPQSWSMAATAVNPVGPTLPSLSPSAMPAAGAVSSPAGMIGPPVAGVAGRGAVPAMPSPVRFDLRPAVVQRPVAAG